MMQAAFKEQHPVASLLIRQRQNLGHIPNLATPQSRPHPQPRTTSTSSIQDVIKFGYKGEWALCFGIFQLLRHFKMVLQSKSGVKDASRLKAGHPPAGMLVF